MAAFGAASAKLIAATIGITIHSTKKAVLGTSCPTSSKIDSTKKTVLGASCPTKQGKHFVIDSVNRLL